MPSLLLLLACGSPAPETVAPAPSAAPRPAPSVPLEPIGTADDLDRVFSTPLERGACRDGRIRIEGVSVVDARDEAHRALLADRLGTTPLDAAAISLGVIWDARTALTAAHAEPIADTLVALHRASVEDVRALDCRKIKSVKGEGVLWNARGDALALLSRLDDRDAARAALDRAITEIPELADAGGAAFGDPDAIHTVNKAALKELCDGRTWHTSWLMRSLDIGTKNGSLLPLGQMQTGACDQLAAGVDPNIITPRQ